VKTTSRITLALVILTGVGVGLAVLMDTGSPALGSRIRWQTSKQCLQCHEAIGSEWHGSHHQISFLNPEVKKLSDDFKNTECQACHLPRPVFEIGIGKRTLPRMTRPDEGVDCLTCHLGAEGEILARHDVPGAPCKPRANATFTSVDLCASCHNQHGTTDQFRASSHAKQGGHCNDCHMEPVPRNGVPGQGRSHVFIGAHDKAMLTKAATFEVGKESGEIVATVTNVGAGHNFPTEERHRAVDVLVRFVASDGTAGEWQRLWRFRQPYRDEPGENTQLPAGESKTVRIAIQAGAKRAEARLWYRLNPFAVDGDAASTLLFERVVALP